MRRLLVLAAALGMMWGLHLVRVQVATGPADPLTLAAIGFVVLAAFTVGELGAGLGLPKVTGYIVAGVVLGPSVSDILSQRVVAEMGMFNTLALGLIATNAGLELDLSAIRRISRTLFATVGAKLLLLPLLVGAPLVLLQRFHPLLPVEGGTPTLVLALLVAVLAIGTSPAIALAVVSDSRARGRLSDLTLAIAVVKDLVVVVFIAAAVAVGRALLAGGGFDAHILADLAAELGGSLAVGAAVGLILIQYIRRVHTEMLLAVLVMILLVAELSHVLHLELLLVFIAAGFVVRNLSDYEHDLLEPLSRISVPVYVVFFTTAGGGVDLATTLALLPLALLLAGGRAAAFAVAGWVGCRIGGEKPEVSRNAWLAYLPQAGVTLGLVLLASQALPTLSQPILRLGMALVAVNLLVGPVTLATALRRAGETPDRAPAPSPEPDEVASDVAEAQAAEPPAVSELDTLVGEPQLAAHLRRLADDLTADVHGMAVSRLSPMVSSTRAWATAALAPSPDRTSMLRGIGAAVDGGEPHAEPRWESSVVELLDRMVGRVHDLPTVTLVPFAPDLLQPRPNDSLLLRTRLLVRRLGLRLARLRGRAVTRRAPVRRAARVALEPRLAEAAAAVSGSWYRARAAVLALLQDTAVGTRDAADAAREVERVLALWVERASSDLDHALRSALAEAATTLAVAGSPRLPQSRLRFSTVEGRVRASRDHIAADAEPWRARLEAARASLRATLHLELSALAVSGVLERRALAPLEAAREALVSDLAALADRLERVASEAPAAAERDPGQLESLLASIRELYPKATQLRHRRAEARLRRETQSHRLVADLREVVANAPSGAEVMASEAEVARAARPSAVVAHAIDLSEHLETVLVDELVPRLNDLLSGVVEEVNRAEGRTRDLQDSTTFGVELALDDRHVTAGGRARVIADTLGRAAARSRTVHDDLASALDTTEREIEEIAAGTAARLHRVLGEEARSASARARSSVRVTRRRLLARFEPHRDRLRARWQQLVTTARGLGEQSALRDLRIRSGQERLDTASVRAYLELRHPTSADLPLPAVVRRLFAPIPLDDRRLFVAHRPLLDQLQEGVEALDRGQAPAMLVTGPRGTGRSSLLNVFRLQLATQDLLWLDDTFARRSEGLLRALAVEAGAAPTAPAVAAALTSRRTVVVVDNLEHWFLPTAAGVEELEAFLEVVVGTVGQVLWVVSVGATPLAVLGELVPVRSGFTRILETRALGWQELAEVMAARERLSGFETTYVPHPLQRFVLGLRGRDEREAHFRALTRATRGNLRAALLAHARSLRPHGDATLLATEPQLSPLPFLDQLPPSAVAILAQAMRWGPMDEDALAAALAMPPAALRHATTLLLGCGALAPLRPGPSAPLAVPVHLESPLAMALAELGLHVGVAP